MQKRLLRMKSKLDQVFQLQAVDVDKDMAGDLKTIMEEEEEQIFSDHLEGSFPHIFWSQQKEAARSKDMRGMRWHPLMIKWCIYLRHQSAKAYETLRRSGCVMLPSQRTLRDYSHAVKAEPGFSAEVDHQLMLAAKVTTSKEWRKLVVLLIDEMYIREHLVYEKHTGTLIGFCNLGEVNNHLLAFECSLEQSSNECPLAKSVVTFMVKGLFTPLRHPYVHFLCFIYVHFLSLAVTGDLLFQPFWEAMYHLERMGLKVGL